MPFNTKSMRNMIEKYQKWLMIGLIVFLLIIFTVTDVMQNMMMGGGGGEGFIESSEVVGSFYVVPKEKVEIEYRDFARAQQAVKVWNAMIYGNPRDFSDVEVWTHLILREAARTQGMFVSDQELVKQLRQNPMFAALMDDKQNYAGFTRDTFGMTRAEFENAFREALLAQRVRRLYIDSFTIAPPATREDLVDKFAPGSFEFVEASWAALDAGPYVEEAAKNLAAAEDAEKKLRAFFESDPAVKESALHFRRPRRYEFEMLYAIHDRLTEENLERAKEMFLAAWPEWSKTDTRRKDAFDFGGDEEIQKYWSTYRERLLKAEGSTLEEIRKQATEQVEKQIAAQNKDDEKDDGEKDDGKSDDGEKDDGEKDDGEKDDGENEDEENEDEGAAPPPVPVTPQKRQAIEEAMRRNGLILCRNRIIRELELRRLYRRIHATAYESRQESLKKVWERLKAVDDKDDPLCSLEPGKGLFVYRAPDSAMSRPEIEKMKDGDVVFGPNVGLRVSQAAREKLPHVRKSAEILGDAAHGRMIVRVTGLERERRKTFDELDDGEKMILRTEFHVPHLARERAKEVLQELKKRIDEGKVKPDGFAAAAKSLGARVAQNERVVAKSGYMLQPDDRLLFPDALAHMRDRYFLRSRLASLLATDRRKKEEERIEPGSWLDVQVRSDTDDAEEDPGTAYLVLLIDREEPDASTMPEEALETARSTAIRQLELRDRARWDERPRQLFNDFDVEFYGVMKERVEQELAQRG